MQATRLQYISNQPFAEQEIADVLHKFRTGVLDNLLVTAASAKIESMNAVLRNPTTKSFGFQIAHGIEDQFLPKVFQITDELIYADQEVLYDYDVVVSVNSEDVTDPDQGAALIKQAEGVVRVAVARLPSAGSPAGGRGCSTCLC